jgi:peptide chain release factor 3
LHPRTGKRIRLRRAHRVFGQDRETVDEAFPGDIVGLVNPGEFHLGDTLCEGREINFAPLPQFSPEYFGALRCRDTSRRKQFERGLTQLIEEGAVQALWDDRAARRQMILGAVGELQFDVVQYRLEREYNAETDVEWLPYKVARWVEGAAEDLAKLRLSLSAKLVKDQFGQRVVLFPSNWEAEYLQREHPRLVFSPHRLAIANKATGSSHSGTH